MIQSPDPNATPDADAFYAPSTPAPPAPSSPAAAAAAAAPQPGRRKPGRPPTSDAGLPTLSSTGGAAAAAQPPVNAPAPPVPQTLYSALRSLFVHIARNQADKGAVAPRAFIEKLKELNEAFRARAQQDAHEFLNYTLNQIMEEMNDARRQGTPPAVAEEDRAWPVST
jgi:ubiquitin carboxyl-terminal hydrolase 9/13